MIDAKLPEELNKFYARFDRPAPSRPINSEPDEPPSQLSVEDTRRGLSKLNVKKAPGRDDISPRLLRCCTDELSGVLCDIFNWSLRSSHVPNVLKKSVIIPVPKRTPITCHNDYRPVALTSIVMKLFEKFVLQHLKSILPSTLDPFQFGYRKNRSIEDAVALTLHHVLNFLDLKEPNYVRLLLIDYSSAFNTISPFKLHDKLMNTMRLNRSLCDWILDFLLHRTKRVKIGNHLSGTLVINTGTPQGCVLSPLLFSLCTSD